MARRKNAAALFEVIHADNRFPRRHDSSRWSLRAPRLLWPFGRRSSSPAGEPAAPMPVQTIDYAPAPAVPQAPFLLSRLAAALIPPMPRFGMSFDPERQLVRFQLSYTGAVVSAFALVVAIALAYMVGRQSSHRPIPALAEQTTEELRNGPVYADVLDLHGSENDPPVAMAVGAVPVGSVAQPAATPPSAPSHPTAARPVDTPQRSSQQGMRPSQWTEPKAPSTFMVSDSNRTVGLQYVIVQSYPQQEKQLAEAAVQMLNQHGVLCTIETGLPYAPSWYCVVGITGFARIRDVPEYQAYITRIQRLSEQFAGTSKFKKFEPKPFRWRESKAAAAKQ